MQIKPYFFEQCLAHQIPNVISIKMQCEQKNFKIKGEFRISRGAKIIAETIHVSLTYHFENGDVIIGRGESVPYKRYGESCDAVKAQLESIKSEIEKGLTLKALQPLLPSGAARNAIDCALWDVLAKYHKKSVWALLTEKENMKPVLTAITVSLDTAEIMAKNAHALTMASLIKLKLSGDEQDLDRIKAVCKARPDVRLILDANEAWRIEQLNMFEKALRHENIALIEQPLHADEGKALAQYEGQLLIGADESAHDVSSFKHLQYYYDMINIKLDKTGGLTEAIKLLFLAKSEGMKIMIGSMVCSSLGIAPALIIAQEAELADLDGPLLLAEDMPCPIEFDGYYAALPERGLWGK